jgi:hypothetical protein
MQQNRPVNSISAAAATTAVAIVSCITIPCLYTKQKTKKRKTFNDGYLKVYESNGHCILYTASENFISVKECSLDSQYMTPQAAKKILQGESL